MSSPWRLSERLPAIREYLLQAIFPELCLHCGERVPERGLVCARCGSAIPAGECNNRVANGYYQTQFLYPYEGVQKSIFKAAKFSGFRRAEAMLFALARNALKTLAQPGTLFLPMPSSRRFLTRLMQSALPRDLLQTEAFVLNKGKWGRNNKQLGEAARFRRIRESLVRSTRAIRRADCYVLCDDVLTTGATLGQAAWLLESSGVPREKIVLWALLYRAREIEDER